MKKLCFAGEGRRAANNHRTIELSFDTNQPRLNWEDWQHLEEHIGGLKSYLTVGMGLPHWGEFSDKYKVPRGFDGIREFPIRTEQIDMVFKDLHAFSVPSHGGAELSRLAFSRLTRMAGFKNTRDVSKMIEKGGTTGRSYIEQRIRAVLREQPSKLMRMVTLEHPMRRTSPPKQRRYILDFARLHDHPMPDPFDFIRNVIRQLEEKTFQRYSPSMIKVTCELHETGEVRVKVYPQLGGEPANATVCAMMTLSPNSKAVHIKGYVGSFNNSSVPKIPDGCSESVFPSDPRYENGLADAMFDVIGRTRQALALGGVDLRAYCEIRKPMLTVMPVWLEACARRKVPVQVADTMFYIVMMDSEIAWHEPSKQYGFPPGSAISLSGFGYTTGGPFEKEGVRWCDLNMRLPEGIKENDRIGRAVFDMFNYFGPRTHHGWERLAPGRRSNGRAHDLTLKLMEDQDAMEMLFTSQDSENDDEEFLI